jgi:hypothetical protein
VRLARLCGDRALEQWRRDSPLDDRPQALLRLADRVIAGAANQNAAIWEVKYGRVEG